MEEVNQDKYFLFLFLKLDTVLWSSPGPNVKKCAFQLNYKALMHSKFRRLWCSHRASQIFDRTGYEFDLDFGIQIFERLAGG